MKNTYKPLFIVKDFNIDTNAVGIQAKRFVDSLIKTGINPVVYCVKTNERSLLHDENSIHLVKELPHKFFSAVIRRLFPDILYLPDIDRYTFLPFLTQELDKEIEINNYDWIHSISNPCSSHLAGLYLKEKTNLPWVAQFYDPWVGNCYREYKTKYLRKLDEDIEYKVAVNADIIIHTNEIIKNDWIKRYGEIVIEKIFVMPFSYDENCKITVNNRKRTNTKLSVLYVGGLYFDRNIDDLIKSINILKTKIDNLEEKIEFKFIGNVSNHDKKNIKTNHLDNLFILLGQKPYNQLSDYYKDADLLLVIDAPANENLFFPSKLIEYFTYKIPILGISPKISVTHDVLLESGNMSIENGEIGQIVDYLTICLNDFDSKLSFDHNYYKNYSPSLLSEKYIKLIEKKVLLIN